ncbi:uncharacterized protein [Amphiura filiformis]|uniref:uncharacterized protein n=1 Tax=Amphiura filiformis TaxID=82378 RepID=UPI003B217293
MTDKWLEQELELNQQHEEILERREALLYQAEWQLTGNHKLSSTIAQHWVYAKQRNQALIDKIKHSEAVFKERASIPPSRDFVASKEKYWQTLEQELPGWKTSVKAASRSNPPSAR